MREPVVTVDGQTYERACIAAWLQNHATSPLTGQDLESKLLIPCIALRNAIERAVQGLQESTGGPAAAGVAGAEHAGIVATSPLWSPPAPGRRRNSN